MISPDVAELLSDIVLRDQSVRVMILGDVCHIVTDGSAQIVVERLAKEIERVVP